MTFNKKLGLLVLIVTLGNTAQAQAKKYKQCAVGMFGVGYVAKVNWYHPKDLSKVVQTRNVALGEKDCHTGKVPHFMTIRAMGSDVASVVSGIAGGAAAGILVGGTCAAVTGPAATGCASLTEETVILTGSLIIANTGDKGVFYGGYAQEVEFSGQTWSPNAEVSDYFNTKIPEAFELKLKCTGVKHAGTSNNITVAFYNGNKEISKSTQKGCKDSAKFYSAQSDKITKALVTTDGENAMFIDYARLKAATKGKPYYWGKKGAKGYCSSISSNDAKSWQKAGKLSPKECFRTIEFNRTDKKAYGL